MCRPAFDALDRSWTTFTRSPEAVSALVRWGHRPELATTDLDALVGRTWAAPKPEADRICAELAGLAPDDVDAARTLLQILRPGLRNLGRRFALGSSFDDVDSELIGLAWERIRTYRIDRRPTSVAANILLDVRKHYIRGVTGQDTRLVSLELIAPVACGSAPSAEHEALDAPMPSLRSAHARLALAVDREDITPASAAIVWRSRIQQHDDADIAADLGVGVRTLQRRRQRAERRLALAS